MYDDDVCLMQYYDERDQVFQSKSFNNNINYLVTYMFMIVKHYGASLKSNENKKIKKKKLSSNESLLMIDELIR